ncbi:MAG: nucleoside diphosphate kinase regulator [Bdellovibrionales bacterium]
MKANKAQLLFSNRDFQRLSALVDTVRNGVSILLEEELARATVVPDGSLPADVVAMNSLVKFKDLESDQETEVQLVYPHEADARQGKISVLAPVGAALIGLRIGQSIEWPVPNGRKRRIEVVSVFKEVRDEAS